MDDQLIENLVNGIAHHYACYLQTTRKLRFACCESPIERGLAFAMDLSYEMTFRRGVVMNEGGWNADACLGWSAEHNREQIFPQVLIGEYRVDFLATHERGLEGWGGFVVECDGHDFHERTKEQAARDRRRDRELARMGYPVMRFTGSEIWADPFQCGRSVVVHMVEQAGEAIELRQQFEQK